MLFPFEVNCRLLILEYFQVNKIVYVLYVTPYFVKVPSYLPTNLPTKVPTVVPTKLPTEVPTVEPTDAPTLGCLTIIFNCSSPYDGIYTLIEEQFGTEKNT